MRSPVPWPPELLAARSWGGIQALLARLLELSRSRGLPGTLLVVGDAGLGREALALELAAMLVCREDGGPGCDCASCGRVRRGIHPDVEMVAVLGEDPKEKKRETNQQGKRDPKRKTEIGVDQVRAVADGLAQRPYEGRRRVFIVANAHTPPLNEHAASAFLKTLEEPPAHVSIILLAANCARVLPTIVSRAVQLRVPPPGDRELADFLANLHRIPAERAAALVEACQDDPAVALSAPAEELITLTDSLHRYARAALEGDPLALLRLGACLRREPQGEQPEGSVLAPPGSRSRGPRESLQGERLLPSVLARLAAGAAPEAAEAILAAAAALIQGARRRSFLHLDLEATTVGALARLVAEQGAHPGAAAPG